jgi:hypothetical protein
METQIKNKMPMVLGRSPANMVLTNALAICTRLVQWNITMPLIPDMFLFGGHFSIAWKNLAVLV